MKSKSHPKIHKEVKKFLPMVEAVVDLFAPFVEAAVHDLSSGKLVAIYNNISKRKVGDRTPLKELGTPVDKFPDYFDPYYKTNWDGRQLKCTSITIWDERGRPAGLICLNMDTTFFRNIQLNLASLLEVKATADNPLEIFENNWKDKINIFVQDHLKKHKATIDSLDRRQKKELVQELYNRGVFNYKNCAVYIADLLNVSRATIYNYLK